MSTRMAGRTPVVPPAMSGRTASTVQVRGNRLWMAWKKVSAVSTGWLPPRRRVAALMRISSRKRPGAPPGGQ